MIGLVMCGGRGTRMDLDGEKLLLKYKRPVVEHVISALEESGCLSRIVCATSPNAPRTAEFVRSLGIETVETGGDGYSEDLGFALKKFDEPVLVVSGDLPLLDAEIVKKIAAICGKDEPWTSVLVRESFLDRLGARAEYLVSHGGERCALTGISVVNPRDLNGLEHVRESYVVLDDKRVAVNHNTQRDYELLGAA